MDLEHTLLNGARALRLVPPPVAGCAFGIVVEAPYGPTRTVPLTAETPLIFGRAAGDRVGVEPAGRLDVDDAMVSPTHARIEARADGVHLFDLASASGVWIGGARIGSALLGVGASALLGATSITIVGAAEIGSGGDVRPRSPSSNRASVSANGQNREGDDEGDSPLAGAVGGSLPMRALGATVARYAALSAPALIRGESGSGKELVARALHAQSPRSAGPFQAVNLAALPRELAESELFGHERGAFTGAAAARPGVFELADGGTVFLDELGELPLDMQAKLLRVLETGEVRRLGARASKQVDVRVVAATWAPLEQRVADGTFREDLFHRIAVLMIEVPPLRDRAGDIPALARWMLGRARAELGLKRLSPGAMSRLMSERWPGNVRQLRNVVYRAAANASGDEIALADVTNALTSRPSSAPPASGPHSARGCAPRRSKALVRDRGEAEAAVSAFGGSISAAARACGVPRETLRDLVRGVTKKTRRTSVLEATP